MTYDKIKKNRSPKFVLECDTSAWIFEDNFWQKLVDNHAPTGHWRLGFNLLQHLLEFTTFTSLKIGYSLYSGYGSKIKITAKFKK